MDMLSIIEQNKDNIATKLSPYNHLMPLLKPSPIQSPIQHRPLSPISRFGKQRSEIQLSPLSTVYSPPVSPMDTTLPQSPILSQPVQTNVRRRLLSNSRTNVTLSPNRFSCDDLDEDFEEEEYLPQSHLLHSHPNTIVN